MSAYEKQVGGFERERGVLVVYFDGVCNLCNAFIDFLVRIDSTKVLRYAPLQGTTAKNNGVARGSADLASVVVVANGMIWNESDAVLRVFEALGGRWRMLAWVRIVPKPIRDSLYRTVARNRYRIFGRRDTCRVPTKSEQELFLP